MWSERAWLNVDAVCRLVFQRYSMWRLGCPWANASYLAPTEWQSDDQGDPSRACPHSLGIWAIKAPVSCCSLCVRELLASLLTLRACTRFVWAWRDGAQQRQHVCVNSTVDYEESVCISAQRCVWLYWFWMIVTHKDWFIHSAFLPCECDESSTLPLPAAF